jgi:hypothetical protein
LKSRRLTRECESPASRGSAEKMFFKTSLFHFFTFEGRE